MRPGPVAISGLIAGASAFARPNSLVRPREDIPKKCGLGASDEDARKDTWSQTGGPFLDDFFEKNDFEDWSKRFFEDNINNGSQGIVTHDCKGLDSTSCGGIDDCENYASAPAFFVHQAMDVLHEQLHYVSQNMINQVVDNLGETADTVSDLYGPPEPDTDGFNSFMIGGMIVGAAAAYVGLDTTILNSMN